MKSWSRKFTKDTSRVVLRSDIVKDVSGSYAAFTGQGSSASQMTAAKVLDVIAKLPDCHGQAADSITAYIRVNDMNGPNPGQTVKIRWFLLEEICTITHLRASCGKDSSRKFCWNLDGKKLPNWECLFVHQKQGSFVSVYVDDITMAGQKHEKC